MTGYILWYHKTSLVSVYIISDKGAQFTSQLWKLFQEGFGSKVNLSTALNTKTDGQAECNIKTLQDMFRIVIDYKGNWYDHLTLIKFSYNNSYDSSIPMLHCEALYGLRCRSHIGWFDVGKVGLIGAYIAHEDI